MSGEAADVVAQRLAAQLLVGPPAAEPAAVVERLLAVQAQDPRGARLAVRARTSGLRAADVDWALTADRSLVTTWRTGARCISSAVPTTGGCRRSPPRRCSPQMRADSPKKVSQRPPRSAGWRWSSVR